jgi:hypothetical protein
MAQRLAQPRCRRGAAVNQRNTLSPGVQPCHVGAARLQVYATPTTDLDDDHKALLRRAPSAVSYQPSAMS